MDLISTNDKMLVADFDIPVYKAAIKNNDGKYITYNSNFRSEKIEVNKMQEPFIKGGIPNKKKEAYCYGEGFVYAYPKFPRVCNFAGNILALKAYIPAGTRFVIDDMYESIAADRIMITDKVISAKSEEAKESSVGIIAEMVSKQLHTNFDKLYLASQQVCIGDIVYSDLSYTRAFNIDRSKKPIGIVGYIDIARECRVISLTEENKIFDENCVGVKKESNAVAEELAKELLDKEELMSITKMNFKLIEKHAMGDALGYIHDYKAYEEDDHCWFLPMMSDILQFGRDGYLINAAITIAGGKLINFYDPESPMATCHVSNDSVFTIAQNGICYKISRSSGFRIRLVLNLKMDKDYRKFIAEW